MRIFRWVLFIALVSTCFAATASHKKTAPSRKSSSKNTAKTIRKAKGPVSQQTPTPERYKEIQQALTAKGYLKSEPTGVWDAQSSDALRQYQNDNKLSPTGKLSSASLISLGLGPASQIPPSQPRPYQVPPVEARP